MLVQSSPRQSQPMPNGADGQGSTGHYAQRRIRQRVNPFRMHIFGKQRIDEIVGVFEFSFSIASGHRFLPPCDISGGRLLFFQSEFNLLLHIMHLFRSDRPPRILFAKKFRIHDSFIATPPPKMRGTLRGTRGFYAPRVTRGAAVLVDSVVAQIEELLAGGASEAEVAKKLELKLNTLQKAIRAGRIRMPAKKKEPAGSPLVASTKSERAEADCAAPMGRGATATIERLAASLGGLDEAAPRFDPALDVSKGGVLLALPALLACGLLRHSGKYFRLPAGFYGLKTIFVLLAFMALARLKSIEALRYYAPGEWGKLLGLDRAPEVRTLRVKVKTLADQNQAFSWSSELCKEWMAEAPQEAAVLYVDGHVRVYYGNTKQLPKHYIARERLCLSATADYWVNAMDGKPFFVMSQAVDPGLLQVLESDIVPRLENDVPNQPSSDQLEADPLLHRFTVVFDREGYSPNFFVKMKDRRIACLTYRKYPGEDWPQQEFFPTDVRLSSGQLTTIRLAERGTWLGDRLWVREVR